VVILQISGIFENTGFCSGLSLSDSSAINPSLRAREKQLVRIFQTFQVLRFFRISNSEHSRSPPTNFF